MTSNPQPGEIWRHHKGAEYGILCITNSYAVKPGWVKHVVYTDSEGLVWSRPLDEFLKRFTLKDSGHDQ